MLKKNQNIYQTPPRQGRQKVVSPGIAPRMLQLLGATLLYFINLGFIQTWRWQFYIDKKCILLMSSSSELYEKVLFLGVLNEYCHTYEFRPRATSHSKPLLNHHSNNYSTTIKYIYLLSNGINLQINLWQEMEANQASFMKKIVELKFHK